MDGACSEALLLTLMPQMMRKVRRSNAKRYDIPGEWNTFFHCLPNTYIKRRNSALECFHLNHKDKQA
jgi:hypothetical protein